MMQVDQAKQPKELLKEAFGKSCGPRAPLHRAGGLPPLRTASQNIRLSSETA